MLNSRDTKVNNGLSLKSLAADLLNVCLDKSQELRCSDWEADQLTLEQVRTHFISSQEETGNLFGDSRQFKSNENSQFLPPDDLRSPRRPGVHRSLPQPPRPLLRSRSRLFQRELLSRVGCPLPGSGGRALQGPRRRRRQGGRRREKEENAENAHI